MFMSGGTGDLVEPMSGRRLSAPEIRERLAMRCANYLARGLAAGDRVFLHYGNCVEFFIDVMAVWYLGGCVAPVDGRLTPFEVTTLAASARPRFSVWDEAPHETLARELQAMAVTVVGKPDGTRTTGYALPPSAMRLDDEALILFTSGTTGNPKGVVHTHRSLRARWTSLRSALGLSAFKRSLCLLPTHFGHGLICNSLYPWLYGQDLYVMPPFRADLLMQLGQIIDEHAITFMSSVPTVWRLAIKTASPPQRASLKRIFCGSAPLSGALWRSVQQWSDGCEVMNAYGITETGSWLAGTTVAMGEPADGFIGEAWGGVLRVLRSGDTVAFNDGSTACAPEESGHIWINTPALMKGYLDRDDLTAAVVTQGWFSTGDIGLLDEQGHLHLRGRLREEINKGGMKVYPSDIDAVIESFADTLDVCAFAIEDTLLGEDVGAAVVLRSASDQALLALRAWAAQRLAAHQLPKRWYVLTEIPRTSRGKVNRSAVAAHCAPLTPVPFAQLLKRET